MQPTLCKYIENINEMCIDLQKYTEMLWKCCENLKKYEEMLRNPMGMYRNV